MFSVFRCLAICYPLRIQMTNRTARMMITALWVTSFLLPVPWLLYFDLVPVFKNDTTLFCIERWPDWLDGNLYFLIVNVMLGYVLPLILISICYILIYVRVWKRNIPTDTKSAQMERIQQKSKYKVCPSFLLIFRFQIQKWHQWLKKNDANIKH